jgi:hypothetical protein
MLHVTCLYVPDKALEQNKARNEHKEEIRATTFLFDLFSLIAGDAIITLS